MTFRHKIRINSRTMHNNTGAMLKSYKTLKKNKRKKEVFSPFLVKYLFIETQEISGFAPRQQQEGQTDSQRQFLPWNVLSRRGEKRGKVCVLCCQKSCGGFCLYSSLWQCIWLCLEIVTFTSLRTVGSESLQINFNTLLY